MRKRKREQKEEKKKEKGELKRDGIICKEDMKRKEEEDKGYRGGQKRKIRAQHKQLNSAASAFKLPLASRKGR